MFSLNETTLLNAIQGGGIFSVINSIIGPGYGIYLKTGAKALSPSSFLGIDYEADSSVISAPIESGSYSSYNKVKRPPIIRVLFVLEGWSGLSGSLPNLTNFSLTSRAGMLGALDAMVNSATTYDIETPDTVYQDYDLVRYNYRTSDRDVTLLTVEAIFQAVLEEAEVSLSSSTSQEEATPYGLCKTPNGFYTSKVNSSASDVTLSEVSSAISGIKGSISSATTTLISDAKSVVSETTSGLSTALNGPATSAIGKLSKGVNQLVSMVT